jgi:hypothetical protein
VTLIIVASTTTAARTSTTTGTSATAATRSSATTTARTSAATETTTAFSLGTRFVNVQRAATEIFSVQGRDRFFSFGGIGHFDESESARTPGVTVSDNAHLVDLSVRFKQRTQLGFSCAVGDIADKKLLHTFPFLRETKLRTKSEIYQAWKNLPR